jgi:hypothetical protein
MRVAVLLLAVAAAGCAARTGDPPRARERFEPKALRQPAVFVRVVLGSGSWSDRQRAVLPSEYEGALVEAMNARAVLVRDVQLIPPRDRLDRQAAVARAREVGADHALLVETAVAEEVAQFCEGTRQAFRRTTTVWKQRLTALRASDGAVAFETPSPVEVTGLEPDCDLPRESRPRSAAEQLGHAVETLLARMLGG